MSDGCGGQRAYYPLAWPVSTIMLFFGGALSVYKVVVLVRIWGMVSFGKSKARCLFRFLKVATLVLGMAVVRGGGPK